jgi:glycosyltransferase involved in cell wall biosynthesis
VEKSGTDSFLKSESSLLGKDIKISTFICVTNAVKRGDTFIEAIKTHLYFSDELIVVDGGSTDGTIEAIKNINDNRIKIVTLPWPQEWCWSEFARHWNFGYENCTGDWVAAGETDHIFHENHAVRLRAELKKFSTPNYAVADIDKAQFVLADHMFSKSRFAYFLNKKHFGNKIGYGLDRNYLTDLAHPILIENKTDDLFYEGTAIREPQIIARLPLKFFNYVWTFKTWEMIFGERKKACAGWNKYEPFFKFHGRNLPVGDDDIEKTLKQSMLDKHYRCNTEIPRHEQPKIMQQKLKELKTGMFGYDLCGLINNN